MEYVIALLLGLVVAEIYAWLPQVSRWIVELAVRFLPEEHRARWREEFQEGQNALPQTAWRFVNALTLCYGALIMRRNLAIADGEDAFEKLDEEVNLVLSTYESAVSTIRETAAEAASSRRRLRPALYRLQNQLLSLSDRCSEETLASITGSVKGISECLLNSCDRAHGIVAVEIEKVSKALREAGPSAANISRKWSYLRKTWRVQSRTAFHKNCYIYTLSAFSAQRNKCI